MQSDKDIPGISCGLIESNVFEWEVMLMISDDCKYYGGTCLGIWPRNGYCRKGRLMKAYRRILPRSSHIPT